MHAFRFEESHCFLTPPHFKFRRAICSSLLFDQLPLNVFLAVYSFPVIFKSESCIKMRYTEKSQRITVYTFSWYFHQGCDPLHELRLTVKNCYTLRILEGMSQSIKNIHQ